MKKKINILLTIIMVICITISLTSCDFTSLDGDWESNNGFIFTFDTDNFFKCMNSCNIKNKRKNVHRHFAYHMIRDYRVENKLFCFVVKII